ncbi:MAG: hypothetical protein ABIA75_06810 [Candidatus Neomarinimicrobiota bacterium]
MIRLEFIRAVDVWFWGLLAAALLALIWSFYALRSYRFARVLLVLRTLLIVSALVLLLQPRLTLRKVISQPRTWHLFIDNTLSMAYHQNFSLAALNNGIKEIGHEFDKRGIKLNNYHFDQTIRPVSGEPAITGVGSSTDLGQVISQIGQMNPEHTSGIVLVTDGQPTQGVDPVQLADKLKVPVFTIGVGDTTPLVDVAIHSIDVPTIAIKGEDLTLTVIIASVGPVRERINVMLMDGDEPVGSRFLTVYGQGSQQEVRFQFKPEELGVLTYEIVASSLEDEINVRNNRQKFQVSILKDRYKVALVTGMPNYNTAVLKKYLNRQPRIALDHFQQIGNDFKPPFKNFWETKYDLIIFDNFPTTPLSTQWQRILAGKVATHKSSLAWFVGPDVSADLGRGLFPFFYIKPVGDIIDRDKKYNWYLTDLYIESEIGALFGRSGLPAENQLPPLHPGLMVESAHAEIKPFGYLSGPVNLPLVLLGEKENLRSFIWTAADFYQLQYQLTGGKYSQLAGQMLDGILAWLLRTGGAEKLYFRLNKDFFQQGEAILVTGSRLDVEGKTSAPSSAYIKVFHQGNRISSTELTYNGELRRWEGELWASKPGNYDFEITVNDGTSEARQTGTFTVTEGQIELNKVFLNRPALLRIAEKTGGEYYPWNLRFNLYQRLNLEETVSMQSTIIRFGEQYLVLVYLLVLLTVEWIIRRRFGLQ